MLLLLTHLAESLFAEMANEIRRPFLSICGLTKFADPKYVDGVSDFAFCGGALDPFDGKAFDGASRVDVVVRLRAGAAAAFELKLGATRLSKTRVEREWLQPCETSHNGTRWKGNMMAILNRRFPGRVPRDLVVTTESDKVVLERHWFVVAHQNTLNSWKMSPPDFGAHVGQVSFENVVHELGGKNAFNRLVQRLVRRELGRDFYEEWIAPVKGAG